MLLYILAKVETEALSSWGLTVAAQAEDQARADGETVGKILEMLFFIC